MIYISIICPIYNEEKYIEKCVNSIIQQDYSIDDMELLFVDGRSTDKTHEIISEYQKKYRFIKSLDNPYKIVPYAMNIGIKNSIGNIIIRIDAHAFYPNNYISSLVSKLIELNADNIGGFVETDVLNKTPKTLAIKEVLSNTLGVGNSLFRTGIHKITEVDTVPFGCYRKETFQKHGLYDVRLVRNQDIELNKRIKRGGGKILLLPNVYCVYYARETYKALMKNNYQNGRWNILTVFYTKMFDSLSIRHFIPMIFLLSLIIPIFFSLLFPPLIFLSLLSLITYLILISFASIKIAVAKQLNLFYLMTTFLVLHLSYGFGSLKGLVEVLFIKNDNKISI